jgi:hypothetical protein
MTPAQALATATTTAAELLGEQTRLGRLAPGFTADIVAIEGKPLETIADVIGGVRWVMKDGIVVVGSEAEARRQTGVWSLESGVWSLESGSGVWRLFQRSPGGGVRFSSPVRTRRPPAGAWARCTPGR